MKKVLLASTAIVGGALVAAPAMAGNVTAGDNYSVSIRGAFWHQMYLIDDDFGSAGYGRGYGFGVGEAEVHVNARATADNGMKYGVTLELNANEDDRNDTNGADEAYAQISGDNWGTIQLGMNDGAFNQMKIGSFNTNKSGVGTLGGVTALATSLHVNDLPAYLVRADAESVGEGPADASKITYFSPRFSGFQLGVSHTPDAGYYGRNRDTDNDGNVEKIWDLGVNYVGKFDDVGVSLAALYQTGERETATGAAATEDLSIWQVGALVSFSGLSVGADYRDNGENAAGADAGTWWSVGAGYSTGPWGIDAHYALGEVDVAGGENSYTRYGIGASYAVAPGWRLTGDIEYVDREKAAGQDNKSKTFIITNFFNF